MSHSVEIISIANEVIVNDHLIDIVLQTQSVVVSTIGQKGDKGAKGDAGIKGGDLTLFSEMADVLLVDLADNNFVMYDAKEGKFVNKAPSAPVFPILNQNTTGNAATATLATLATNVTINANLTGVDITSKGNAAILSATNVIAGKYTNSTLTIDTKGRIQFAESGTGGDSTLPTGGLPSQVLAYDSQLVLRWVYPDGGYF